MRQANKRIEGADTLPGKRSTGPVVFKIRRMTTQEAARRTPEAAPTFLTGGATDSHGSSGGSKSSSLSLCAAGATRAPAAAAVITDRPSLLARKIIVVPRKARQFVPRVILNSQAPVIRFDRKAGADAWRPGSGQILGNRYRLVELIGEGGAGVVYRAEDGMLKVIDFGIASLVHAAPGDRIIGTPAYMSPEQIRGEALDARTDVYSLGVMTYEFITGHKPFPDNAGLEDLAKLAPAPLDDLPGSIREVVQKAMAPDREARWDSVEDYVLAFINAAREDH